MKGLFITLFALTTFCTTSGCSEEEPELQIPITYSKNTVQYKEVPGVDKNLLSLDIYHYGEASSARPVVVYVHGGGFAVGDKANKMTNKQNLFSSLGYILVSINYRLSPATYSEDPTRVMYPTHNNDVADAVAWVVANIENYGGDAGKIALLGHSAGAHLVALTGTSQRFLPEREIPLNTLKGVACIDTEGYNVVARGEENNEVYLNAFGQADTYWLEASPVHNLLPGTSYPKFFIAKRGSFRRISYADEFISQLKNVNATVSEVTTNQYDHEGVNDAIGAEGETIITEPLKAFFTQCFE